ncbi:MAG: OmpA family protein [Bdellovibrionales bacterium]|nr:OmpA family protein [Bdellovibrionales bacterium]
MSANSGRAARHLVHDEEVDSEGTWAISYGDMVTLLLCFFILFFQIKPEAESVTRFEQGLTQKLAQKSIPVEKSGGGGGVETMSMGKGQEVGIDKDLLKRLNGVAHEKGNNIIIEFPGISFFQSGETDLTQEGQKALEEFSKSYMGYETKHFVGIRAFTDSRVVRQRPRMTFKDNLELSALRSISTMRTLVKEGLPMSSIRLGGFGELKLTAKDLEKYLIEREKENHIKASEKYDVEVKRLEGVKASHHKYPMGGTRLAPALSKKQLAILKLADTKIENALKAKEVHLKADALKGKDQAYFRDKLARTVVLVIEPKGDRQ